MGPVSGVLRLRPLLVLLAGLVLLLFVFYAVYVTDWSSARRQAEAGDRLRARCDERLAAAQARIDKISLGPDGQPRGLQPFDAG